MKPKIVAIVLNLLILIGAGHGIGPMAIFEVLTVKLLLTGELHFSLTGSYDDRLQAVALLSLIAQLALLVSFAFKNKAASLLTVLGCLTILSSVYVLCQNALFFSIETFSLLFALPSLASALLLLLKETVNLLPRKAR